MRYFKILIETRILITDALEIAANILVGHMDEASPNEFATVQILELRRPKKETNCPLCENELEAKKELEYGTVILYWCQSCHLTIAKKVIKDKSSYN